MSRQESAFRKTVINHLESLHAIAVENPCHPGTPDVECALGWLELKLDEWKKDDTLPLKHLTPQQRTFLFRRWSLGGVALLLIKTGREWWLLDGEKAFICPGKSREWFIDNCCGHWLQGPEKGELAECVRRIYRQLNGSSSPASARDAQSPKPRRNSV